MNSKALVVVAVLLIGGLAAWWFVKNDTEVAPGTGNLPGNAAPPTPTAPAESAKAVTGDLHVAGASTTDPQRTAAAVLADPGKAPGTAATIRGRIVDAGGAPRAGVSLSLTKWSVDGGLEIGDLAVPFERAVGEQPSFPTKPDGTFEVAIAADSVGRIDVRDDDLVFANDTPSVDGRKGDQDLGDLKVLRSGMLQGVVRDEHGRPVPDVRVSASLGVLGFASSETKTDTNGAFAVGKLRAGAWTVRTATAKFQPTTLDLTLQPEERRTDLVLVVKPGQMIAGQVLDDVGMPVAGCKVLGKRREARGGIDIERFSADEAATTDAAGYFTLSGLDGETATIRATSKGHANAVARDVRVGTGDLVLRMDRVASVRGVLVGADGAPIAGSDVSMQSTANTVVATPDGPGGLDAFDFGRDDRARTGADGAFVIERVKPGKACVVAEGKGHRPVRSAMLDVKPGQVVDGVRLVAATGATAKVTVVDESGNPVAGAKVRVQRPETAESDGVTVRARRVEAVAEEDVHGAVAAVIGDRDELGAATTDEHGVALVKGLPAGDAVVTAKHDRHADAVPGRLALPEAGTVETKLSMRTPGFVDVEVVSRDGAPVPDCAFAVRRDGEGGATKKGTTDAKGRARVGPLVAGDYVASLTRGATGGVGENVLVVMGEERDAIAGTDRPFRVVAGETVQVRIEKPILTRVFGTVRGVEGPVANCAVSLGSSDGDELPMGLAGFGARTATTGADGTFAIEDVEAGKYVLRYGKPSQIVKSRVELAVPPQTAELRADLELRTGKVRVQVLAKTTGEPLAGAGVEVEPEEEKPADGQPRRRMMMMTISNDDSGAGSTSMTLGGPPRVVTGADGVAEIDDVPVGSYTVNVRHDKFAPETRPRQSVAQGAVTDLGRVALDQSGTIRGKVLAADGGSVPLALVQCRAADTQEWGPPEMAQGGTFRLDGRKTGKHVLRAMSVGGRTNNLGPEVEVNVVAGETATTELRLPAK